MAKRGMLAVIGYFALAGHAGATGWCDFQPGWHVITHGAKSEKVWVYGRISGQDSSIWVQINNPTAGTGANSVAVALAAQFAGRRLQFYIDDDAICSTFPNWGNKVRHVRSLD